MRRTFMHWALAPLARWLAFQDADNRFYYWLYLLVKRLRWGL